jgi:uncharacterized protein (DUF362 family)
VGVSDGRISSRREFVGSVLAAGLALGGCRRPPAARDSGVAAAAASPAPGADKPLDFIGRELTRESTRPPLHVSSKETLAGIRRLDLPEAEMVLLRGQEPERMVRLGISALGIEGQLVRPGDRVVIKPNFGWARPPAVGATSSPELVRELITLCFEAGAQEVVCLEHSTDATPRAFRINKAYQAIEGTGARLLCPWSPEEHVVVDDFTSQRLHRHNLGWQAVAMVLLTCDVLIDVAAFKHHREVKATGALKNLMGCVWRRASYHQVNLDACIAELAAVLRPTLTVLEAINVLAENGPSGPGRLIGAHSMLVTADPVLADAYACRWLDLEHGEVAYLSHAAELGAGKLPTPKTRIEEVTLS